MKVAQIIFLLSFYFFGPLQAASTFLPDPSSLQFIGGTVDTSSFGVDKDKGDDFEIGTGNSYLEFTSQATQGNLQAYEQPTLITSTVSGNGGTFDLLLQAAVQDLDPLANQTSTTNRTYVRHQVRSNGDTNSMTFTQSYSRAWMPSMRFLNNDPTRSGNLNWSLAKGVDFGGQDSSLVAIDVKYFDENLNAIDLNTVEFEEAANSAGYGNAASFSINGSGTTATMIYDTGASNNTAGLNLRDLNTGNLLSEFIGKIEYTFRTTDGSNFNDGISFQYTTNGAVYDESPLVVPEPTAFVLLGFGALSLMSRRRK